MQRSSTFGDDGIGYVCATKTSKLLLATTYDLATSLHWYTFERTLLNGNVITKVVVFDAHIW